MIAGTTQSGKGSEQPDLPLRGHQISGWRVTENTRSSWCKGRRGRLSNDSYFHSYPCRNYGLLSLQGCSVVKRTMAERASSQRKRNIFLLKYIGPLLKLYLHTSFLGVGEWDTPILPLPYLIP